MQSLERFSAQTTHVAHHLEAFMRQIHETEFPNSVEATEQLLIEQGSDYTKLKVSKCQIQVDSQYWFICSLNFRMKSCQLAVMERKFSPRFVERLRCVSTKSEISVRLNGELSNIISGIFWFRLFPYTKISINLHWILHNWHKSKLCVDFSVCSPALFIVFVSEFIFLVIIMLIHDLLISHRNYFTNPSKSLSWLINFSLIST